MSRSASALSTILVQEEEENIGLILGSKLQNSVHWGVGVECGVG